ncbi:MAG TPA: FAD:protein FMN transferase [Myxococcota bacterium]|nr:FAD:protein FMN transferase [Myxococcota bacterium]
MSATRAIAASALLALGGGCAQSSPPRAISDGRLAMGTLLEISLEGVNARRAARALDDAFAEALRLDGLLSIYDPASEISRLNRAAGRGLQPVDPAVAEVLALSIRYAELTAGAFDVTVGPLVDLWRRAAERGAPPSAAELADARARVGAQQIRLAPGQAALAHAGAMLDLGGIAKGYALDRMLPLLERRGVTRALLSFGQSSIWAIGAPEQLDGWRLFVRAPDGGLAGLITLRDQALSVSGSQGQWVEIGGRRYGHIVDPRSGEPLRVARQALVVAPSAALAEALSVALLVLDAQAGLALVDAQAGCEALLIEEGGELRSTPGWQAAARFEPLSPAPPLPTPRPGARG